MQRIAALLCVVVSLCLIRSSAFVIDDDYRVFSLSPVVNNSACAVEWCASRHSFLKRVDLFSKMYIDDHLWDLFLAHETSWAETCEYPRYSSPYCPVRLFRCPFDSTLGTYDAYVEASTTTPSSNTTRNVTSGAESDVTPQVAYEASNTTHNTTYKPLTPALGYYGPQMVDMPVTTFSTYMENIYVASDLGFSVIDKYGRITLNIYVGSHVNGVVANNMIIAVISADSKLRIYRHGSLANTTAIASSDSIMCINDYIVIAQVPAPRRSVVSYYDYYGNLTSTFYIPYSIWAMTPIDDNNVVFSTEPVTAWSTLIETGPGGILNLKNSSSNMLTALTIDPVTLDIYGSSMGIYIYDRNFNYKHHIPLTTWLDTRVALYSGYIAYADVAPNTTTVAFITRTGDSLFNVSTPMLEYYNVGLGIAITPSGRLVVCNGAGFAIYQLHN